jgi:RNA polymerase sigma-70 factor (ECF subfamily)
VTDGIGVSRWLPWAVRASPSKEGARPLDLSEVHAAHADFVWASLQRLGVRERDLDDLLQEVFVVVHQRLHTFDATRPMQPWLFGICRRVAVAHRRRASVRLEQSMPDMPEETSEGAAPDPEEAAMGSQARERLEAILDTLDAEKRAVFVMFEIDEVPCEAIAAALGIPVGTVYSRLHAARKDFQAALARSNARAARGHGS